MTTSSFNYSDVVAHLEGVGHEYLETAQRLRKLMADTPITVPAAPFTEGRKNTFLAPAPPTKKKQSARTPPGAYAMPMRQAIAQALANGPLTSAELKIAIPILRPGTPPREVDKQCFAEKQAKRIFKGADGRWCLCEAEDAPEKPAPAAAKEGVGNFGEDGRFHRISAVPDKPKNPSGPVTALPSVADLVRRVAREATPRTTIGIIDRVEELMHHRVKRETVSSTISMFLRDGVLIRKGQDATEAWYIRGAEEAKAAPQNGAQHA